MKQKKLCIVVLCVLLIFSCKKQDSPAPAPPVTPPTPLAVKSVFFNDAIFDKPALYGSATNLTLKLAFTSALSSTSLASAVSLTDLATGSAVPISTSLQNADSVLIVQPTTALKFLNKYLFRVSTSLSSAQNVKLGTELNRNFVTQVDSSRKFALLTDDALLDKIQQQTFKYFWDFGHPVSGLARESNSSGETVTSGGSGFGIMAILTGINRNFITRTQGLARIQTITAFLKNTAQKFHGAFPHWLNGSTGAVIHSVRMIMAQTWLKHLTLCKDCYVQGNILMAQRQMKQRFAQISIHCGME